MPLSYGYSVIPLKGHRHLRGIEIIVDGRFIRAEYKAISSQAFRTASHAHRHRQFTVHRW